MTDQQSRDQTPEIVTGETPDGMRERVLVALTYINVSQDEDEARNAHNRKVITDAYPEADLHLGGFILANLMLEQEAKRQGVEATTVIEQLRTFVQQGTFV